MFFVVLIVLSALLIAISAAYFSIYGLAQVFSGAFWSVVIMGIALESGKLVATSFLYRFWDKISRAIKVYLIGAVVILMCITSMGISGYLTAAYQVDTLSLRDTENKLKLYDEELTRLVNRKEEIDRQIAQLPNNYVRARQKLMQSFKNEYDLITPRIDYLRQEKMKLQEQRLTAEAKVGPIVYLARAVGADSDKAIFWFVCLLVLVFDPLAVTLTIAANIAIRERLRAKEKSVDTEMVVAAGLNPSDPVNTSHEDDINSVIENVRREAVLNTNN